MKKLLILLLFPVFGSSYVTPPKGLETCNLEESLGLLGCVAPAMSLLEDQLNVMNITRARGIRITEECRKATKCISQFECATKNKLDKISDLLCDALDYFSTRFASCEKKINKMNPPCIRKIRLSLNSDLSFKGDQCNEIRESMKCIETEVTDICGVEYWTPIQEIYRKVEHYNIIKCKKPIEDSTDAEKDI